MTYAAGGSYIILLLSLCLYFSCLPAFLMTNFISFFFTQPLLGLHFLSFVTSNCRWCVDRIMGYGASLCLSVPMEGTREALNESDKGQEASQQTEKRQSLPFLRLLVARACLLLGTPFWLLQRS